MRLVEVNFVDPIYGGAVFSKFLATEDEIKLLEHLDGVTLYFGEWLGKHSEVYGLVDFKNFIITKIEQNEVETLLKNVGKYISGPEIMNIIEDDKMFYQIRGALLLRTIVPHIEKEIKEKLNPSVAESYIYSSIKEGETLYDDESYADILFDNLTRDMVDKWMDWLDGVGNVSNLSEEQLSDIREGVQETIECLLK